MSTNRGTGPDRVLRMLVTHQMLVYLGGLAAIGTPLFLKRAFDVTLAPGVRTAIVVASLALMVVTYLGERRVGRDHIDEQTGKSTEEYPLRMRAAVAMAVLGLAVGVFISLEVDLLGGLLFIGGAYLFAYIAYNDGEDGEVES